VIAGAHREEDFGGRGEQGHDAHAFPGLAST
jgi:hypothetical protein